MRTSFYVGVRGRSNVCLVAIIPVDARAFIIFNCLIN